MQKDFQKILIDIHTHDPAPKPGQKKIQSYGIHPWDAANNDLDLVREKLLDPQIIFLGEIGLDRKVLNRSLADQKKIFIDQLMLNQELKTNKAIIIHNVRSTSDLLEIKNSRSSFKEQAWIWHGFQGNIQELHQILKTNSWISLGANSLFKEKHADMIKQIPLKRLFLETDDQTEYSLIDIYQKTCEIRSINLEDLCLQIEENLQNVMVRQNKNACGR